MTSCADLREDLALLAGGDLSRDEERALHSHLESCSACHRLLAGLQADQQVLSRILQATFAGEESPVAPSLAPASPVRANLVPAIMARVVTEAHEEAVRRQIAGPTRRPMVPGVPGRAMAVVAAASAAAIVVGAGLLGLATIHGSGMSPARDSAVQQSPVLESPVQLVRGGFTSTDGVDGAGSVGPEVAVRRVPGDGLELTWAGDGRERGMGGVVRTYKVLASSNPRDFRDARALEVAGRQVVTNLPLPASHAADRQVTFFRIE